MNPQYFCDNSKNPWESIAVSILVDLVDFMEAPQRITGFIIPHQDSWYPVSLEFLTDLWIPNVFIYNLKSFQSIAVLKRLAGEGVNFFVFVTLCPKNSSVILIYMLSKFFFEAEFERPPYYYGETGWTRRTRVFSMALNFTVHLLGCTK